MEYEKIKQLIEDMGNSKLSSIDIDFPDGTKVKMKKDFPQVTNVYTEGVGVQNRPMAFNAQNPYVMGNNMQFANPNVIPNENFQGQFNNAITNSLKGNFLEDNKNGIEKNEEDTSKITGNIVKSPMVGTFYIKPSPTSEPYVSIGKEVKEGDTLCIIEAMKLMNEIESEFSGKISKILVNDGETVEYGTPLFEIN